MQKLKRIFKKWRILLLLSLALGSLILIFFSSSGEFGPLREGVAIRAVEKNSSAEISGFSGAEAGTRPLNREVILYIDDIKIKNTEHYYEVISDRKINDTFLIRTNKRTEILTVVPEYEYIIHENEEVETTRTIFNETLNETVEIVEYVPRIEAKIVGPADLGFTIYDAPTSNLLKGLDIQGGTRILLAPNQTITAEDFDLIRDNLAKRLNVFGLSDVSVTVVKNIQFEPEYILIEIAGSTVSDIERLVLNQGKFEGKIGNMTVFSGDDRDILVRKGQGDSMVHGCMRTLEGHACRFSFNIHISDSAAKRQAEATRNLTIIPGESGDTYLSQSLELYLDGELVDSLRIASNLRGREISDISISGSGVGATAREANLNAVENMKILKSVIETGSLPAKLEVVKADTISPLLGDNFLFNALLVALISIFVVGIILSFVYKKAIVVIPMMIALISDLIIVLGSSILINWTLDLAAIAGILLIIGTGVDHLVIITDGLLQRTTRKVSESGKERMKKAFYIVIGAFLTTFATMIPLIWAGAGLVKGFAITTMIGLSIGVFITRPAYARALEILLEEE
jgi:preprotein translocase subunit SecD